MADNLTVDSLRRFKDDATEVRDGFECGIGLGSFNDIKIDDVIETFELREKPRADARAGLRRRGEPGPPVAPALGSC